HLHRIPVIKKTVEAWSVVGSSNGYVGSQKQTDFNKFLVAHSGGKYMIEEGKAGEMIVKNPEWTGPGSVPGAVEPSMGVVFVNEFHNWDREAKDEVFKQGFERGIFKINNNNGGLSTIEVPIRFIIASNEGIGLVGSREPDGTRYGEPLTFEESLAKHARVKDDKQRLKEEIWRTNTMDSDQAANGGRRGISEEMHNRIPDDKVVLLRPLSPEVLREIAELKLVALREALESAETAFGRIRVEWTPEVVQFIQEYQYVAEENARPISSKVEALIENTLYSAIGEGGLPAGGEVTYRIQIERNPDKTASLLITATGADGVARPPLRRAIDLTTSAREPEPMSADEVERLFRIRSSLSQSVIGNDLVIERVARRMIVLEEGQRAVLNPETATKPATTFAFLGVSSVGKTELGKAIARVRHGSERSLKYFDFNQVGNKIDLKEYVLQELVKEWDRTGGNFVAMLAETANAPREVLKGLYDALREPYLRSPDDSKLRPTERMLVIIDGNAGEEWYKDIPREIPEEERRAAMDEIYKQAMDNPDYQRVTLERYYSPAFINRVGMQNIFFFGPLDFTAALELASLKLAQAVGRLAVAPSRNGWRVGFRDRAALVGVLELIDREGFVIDEQGASLDRFVKQEVEEGLRHLMLENRVPNGAQVWLSATPAIDATPTMKAVPAYFTVHVDGRAEPLKLNLPVRKRQHTIPISIPGQHLTAYHEVGHELVRRVLLGDYFKSKKISIIPGVTNFGDHWIRYLGIAVHDQVAGIEATRERFIRELAVLVGGAEAEIWVTTDGSHTAGKSNDINRATAMIERMILQFGLSPKWGWRAKPEGLSADDYKATLTDADRQLLLDETQAILGEARALARAVIRSNEFAFLPLGKILAETGEVDGMQLEAYYQGLARKLVTDVSTSLADRWAVSQTRERIAGTVRGLLGSRPGLEPVMNANVPKVDKIADPNRIHAERVAAARGKANLSRALKLVGAASARCEAAITPKPGAE
ncbi:MAG TPA: hypothetical protein VM598_02365, partial [Bdellovibrionota bacterium]|nr:hypothetical protein [Bdellovibrionota bacterium]